MPSMRLPLVCRLPARPPQVAAREAVRAAVEDALGLPCGLLVEFTGLICWRPGAVIGWHHDANRQVPGGDQRAGQTHRDAAASFYCGGQKLGLDTQLHSVQQALLPVRASHLGTSGAPGWPAR